MPFEYDFGYLSAAISELETYLLSDELFWPVSANPPARTQPYPRLTLGGLLLFIKRAEAFALSASQTSQVIQIENRLAQIKIKWRTKWEEKANNEYVSRLNQWRNYIEEYRQDPDKHGDYYPYEIRWRVIVQLLDNEISKLDDAIFELRDGLDQMLRSNFTQGNFVWEDQLIQIFPESTFWYLYGFPKKVRGQ